MPDLYSLPNEVKACIDHAVRVMADRCLQHPRLDEDPTPVIANERDKFLDEMWKIPEEKRGEQKTWVAPELAARNGTNGHKVHKAGRLR